MQTINTLQLFALTNWVVIKGDNVLFSGTYTECYEFFSNIGSGYNNKNIMQKIDLGYKIVNNNVI